MNDVAPLPFPADWLSEAREAAVCARGSTLDCLMRRADVPAEFLVRLGATLEMPVLQAGDWDCLQPAFDRLPLQEAAQWRCLLAWRGASLLGLLCDPFDLPLQARLEQRADMALDWYLADSVELTAFLRLHEAQMRAVTGWDAGQGERPTPGPEADVSISSIAQDDSAVVKLVNSVLYDAQQLGASDIHLEIAAGGLQVKCRIDGVLLGVISVPGLDLAEQVVSCVKVMAELDIGERRIPQDGRFRRSVQGRVTDYRVSVMPSLISEDVVIRILDKRKLSDDAQALRLDRLGFDEPTLELLRSLVRAPYGMLLVTGPTGSGKTTTMYAALSEVNDGQDKIITIEDPVEYQLPGILQIPVHEKKGLTFSRGLRSILRHDPDKILVGEIRDTETAQIAIQSALTGHLVLTSVHANNVFDVLGRFTHMGVEPYSLVSALNGILAQRLVRLICPQCRLPDCVAPYQKGAGCPACHGSGYQGRRAIGEVLLLNDELRELIVARAPTRLIRDAARRHGTRLLRDVAVDMAASGVTTMEEINRVTFAA